MRAIHGTVMTPPLSKGRLLVKVILRHETIPQSVATIMDPLAYNDRKGSLGVGIPS